MNPNNPHTDSFIEAAWKLQDGIVKRFEKKKQIPRRKDHWLLTMILITISGTLGMWGTLTLWSNGERYTVSLWIGPVKPLVGFADVFACVLSFMLFRYAMDNAQDFEE